MNTQPCLFVADDDEHIVRLLREITRRQAPWVHFESVSDGASVQARALALAPTLLLVDLRMPGADGFTVLNTLRADARTRELRVVLMTGLETDETVRRAAEAGVRVVLKNPLEVATVRALLLEHFPAPPTSERPAG